MAATAQRAPRGAAVLPRRPVGGGAAPTLLLAVHGTRDPRGTAAARGLARAAARRTGAPVRLAFADVLAPDVGEVAATAEGPLVVVPAFLAAGYHVRVDIPGQLERAGRADAVLTPALGGDDRLVTAAARRLRRSGWRPGDAVVLAAAGSSDPAARAEVADAAARLAAHLATPVAQAYVATARPTVCEAVARLREQGAARVGVAAWLLAPGLFHRRLAQAGADTVAAPLCPDPAVADIVAARYHAAVRAAA
ncbi:sirohydrochlorin chelatase [Streptomonospora nanhaiensis]|uniref:Sirohydrochlorin ferrochelatase n=1 Tax=Streptomonospora nanhaiensis TaxID=1323731 RepID=A0A853BI31_9ACTN|nr:CbiX/SirB N-terminal domain-containing protein [Streptomonospora nanhaiensis]MBV2363124.1 sirohydrochlorin chelatase [Streptomonospora nanhaiensis]NYI94384.1 sirohydrochlorin ferrochelatase [Streptomonospora nanhaiensis]